MTKKELEDFVHLLARKTDETQREKFIQYLSIANKPIQNEENVVAEINVKITYVLKEFKKVKQKEICIEGSFNEYYDDWYDDMDEAYIFSNIEAFRSDTTPTNYLRIVFNCENYIHLIPVMMEIYNDSLSKLNKTFLDRTDELCRNIVNDNNYYSLLFLGREFDRVFKFGKNTMGNNCSIVSAKCALSLLLIYFYDGADMMPGIRTMCLETVENMDFKPDKYFFLTIEKSGNIKPEELLFECIRKWKQYANSEYDYKEECIKHIGKEIHTNTANVLKQQARSFYGDCASYIAAFGEVNDSLGNNSSGKDMLVDQYLKEFPRYSAFRRELQYFTTKS